MKMIIVIIMTIIIIRIFLGIIMLVIIIVIMLTSKPKTIKRLTLRKLAGPSRCERTLGRRVGGASANPESVGFRV